MWYPSQKRTLELNRQLHKLEDHSVIDKMSLYDFLTKASAGIHFLATENKLPDYRIWDWIWIGSQLRINFLSNKNIATPALKGLLYLLDWSKKEHLDGETALKDIRWVTETTIESLGMISGGNSRKICLSADELKLVNEMWCSFLPCDDFNFDVIQDKIIPYLEKFSCVSGDGYIREVCSKINYLIDTAYADKDESKWATSALRYLVHKEDVVPDDLGYFGLVDDIYVIEQTISLIEKERNWKPFLLNLNEKWPCLSETIFSECEHQVKLSNFNLTVTGAVLHSLSKKEKTNVILSDIGPTGLTSAFFAVISSIKNQYHENRKSLEILSAGDHIILKSSGTVIKAIYNGMFSREGQNYHFIKLSRKGSVSVSDDIIALMRKSPVNHRQLSSHTAYHNWKQSYSPHPLSNLIGNDVNLDTVNPEILLITRKNNLEWFHSRLKPFGTSIASLIGVRYISSTLNISDLSGTRQVNPLLWCCSDPSVAIELLEGENFRSQFKAKSIIIDAALLASDSFDLASRLMRLPDVGAVSVCGLHERESWRYLQGKGFENWHICIDDVEPNYHDSKISKNIGDAELSVYLKRHRLQMQSSTYTHLVENNFIEKLEKTVRKLRRKADYDPDSGLEVVTIVATALLGAVRKLVLCPDENERGEINRMAKNLMLHCNTMMNFDEDVLNLYQIGKGFCETSQTLASRETKIREILSSHTKQPIAVLCHSSTLAQKQREKSAGDIAFQHVQWLSIDQLRKKEPFETLIISGWLNKLVMREVRNCGFALNKHYIFFPFEKNWDQGSIRAGNVSHTELYIQNEKRLATLGKEYGFSPVNGVGNWQSEETSPAERMVREFDEVSASGVLSHSEWLETKLADTIRKEGRQQAGGESVTRGKLVIFENPGYYIYLPPGGKVICLSNVLDASNNIILDQQTIDSGVSEQLINWPVRNVKPGALLAFPEEKKGDLLDSLANTILENPEETRRLANLWRKALIHAFQTHYANLSELKEGLEKAGISRTVMTLQHWLYSTDIIAPQHCNEEIPIIAKFTGDLELENNLSLVLLSIDQIYKARRRATGKVVEQLLQGDIDHEEGVISLKLDDQEIIYRMLRVKTVDPPVEVVEDKVGVLQYLMA